MTLPILHTHNVKKQQQRFRYTCTIPLWWVSLVCVYYIVYKINSTCSKSFIKVFAVRTQYVIGWIATPPWSIPATTVPLYKYIFFFRPFCFFHFERHRNFRYRSIRGFFPIKKKKNKLYNIIYSIKTIQYARYMFQARSAMSSSYICTL